MSFWIQKSQNSSSLNKIVFISLEIPSGQIMVALKSSGIQAASGSPSFGRGPARILTITNLQEEKAPASHKYYTLLTCTTHWSEHQPYRMAARETGTCGFTAEYIMPNKKNLLKISIIKASKQSVTK